jgi:hypothetical protein
MMPGDARHIDAHLTQLVAQGESAALIADLAAQTWREISIALSPLIGAGGMRALYRRAVYLARSAHPWLEGSSETPGPEDFSDLRAALSQQTSAVAATAHCALLHEFLDLLSSLIGRSLTERLLRSVWDKSPGGDAAQDATP